jgi:O-acetyl-ADP-ribose deacetylase (regulator of RNase III)
MKISIRDRNPEFVAAAVPIFEGTDISVSLGSVVGQPAGAVVSPANSFGFMDGGVDYAYSMFFGWELQAEVQRRIWHERFSELLVGQAIAVATKHPIIPMLIVAPTMRVPKAILDPADVMLATRAAVRIAKEFSIDSIVFPGMGTGCGQVRFDVAALAMRSGCNLGNHEAAFPTSWREAQNRHFNLKG